MSERAKHLSLSKDKLLAAGGIFKDEFILVFLISGFLGFVYGIVYAMPQRVVEAAQIISGVVAYPEPTIWSLSISGLWSFLNQICATFLYLGVSEFMLGYLVSGLLGMLSFQGLSLLVLAFSRNRLLSIATPFLILLTSAYDFGINYLILFVFSETWGVLGLSFTVLLIAVIGNGRYKLGAFLIGLAPAVHGVFGLAVWAIVALSLLCDFKEFSNCFRGAVRYFLFGCFVFICSFAFHVLTSPSIPEISKELASYYLNLFVRERAHHRKPVDFSSVGVYLNIAGFAISLFWLRFSKGQLPVNIRFLLRSFMVFSGLGLIFSALTLLPLEYVPDIIIALRPQRLANFTILSFFGLLMGLSAYYKNESETRFNLLFITGILLLLILGLLPDYFLFVAMFGGSCGLIALKLIAKFKITFHSQGIRLANATKSVIFYLLIFAIGLSIIKVYPPALKDVKYRIIDRRNYELFGVVSRGSGMVLIPIVSAYKQPILWVQHATGRPVLFNSDVIDSLVYTPALGPMMEELLGEVYGLEISDSSEVEVELNKKAWEARTAAQWRDICDKYNVTEILAYADWNLQLPLKASDSHYALYTRPFGQN